MSQLRPGIQPITAKRQEEWALSWPDFVQVVLELTIQAYQAMLQSGIARREWEENTFTINLEDQIRPIALTNDLPIYVHTLHKRYTPGMKTEADEMTTKKAKEIDLLMYGGWEGYDKRHFVWEAKRLGDRQIDQQYSSLNSEYVNEGIYRFIRCEYANNLSDAGMLGYILAGNAGVIVSHINQSMNNIRKNPALPKSNHLTIAEPINHFHDIYFSQHERVDKTLIKLHHLFLTFDYPEVSAV